MRELESRLSSRDVEFEKYRQQIVAKPESKLQAELSIAQLEKVRAVGHYRSFSCIDQKEKTMMTSSKIYNSSHWSIQMIM